MGCFYFDNERVNRNLRYVFEYVIVFLLVFVINYFLFIRKKKRYNKKKVPVELAYLLLVYKIDVKKINYKRFVWIYSLVNTFIVSTVYMIVMYLVEGIVWQLIVGIILLVLLTIICYGIMGRVYERKE